MLRSHVRILPGTFPRSTTSQWQLEEFEGSGNCIWIRLDL